jgi:RNA polymerase sigma factor (sigma-70 family)
MATKLNDRSPAQRQPEATESWLSAPTASSRVASSDWHATFAPLSEALLCHKSGSLTVLKSETQNIHMKAIMYSEIRPELMNLARRMLGNEVEAEDMVQEAWLRWERGQPSEVRSPKAFLTTIVTRLCLNHLDLARVRLEHQDAPLLLEALSSEVRSPAEQAEFTDALAEALRTVLDHLSPTERVVFLLREAFQFEYEDIALVVDRSEENCRQILSRARQRLAGVERSAAPERKQDERVVSEFLNAAETGRLEALLQLLSDGVALAPAPPDLFKPAPPVIYDREVLFQMLGQSLAQLRQGSDGFVLFPVGLDYACVARSGRTAKGAVLVRVLGQKVAYVRLVTCPALLRRLQILMTMSPGGEDLARLVAQNN